MNQSPLQTLHETAGARLRATGERPRLLSYGDVPGEYRAACESCALFDETERGLAVARGPEAAQFLHRLLANDVQRLQDGQGNRNLLLTPKGKVRFDFDLSRCGDEYRMSTRPGEAPALLEALETYHFAEAVELSDETEAHAPLALVGPSAARIAREVLGVEPPEEERSAVRATFGEGAPTLERLPLHGSPALRISARAEDVEALWSALVGAGAQPAGLVAADILRVEAGAARAGEDIDESVYPQEARLESAFSLDKGCYVGQEVVAKIDTYGGLNKCLVALAVSHGDPVPRGARLQRLDEATGEWRDLGVVTSWAYSFVHDSGLVLAYVKRRHQAVGTTFRVGDGPAEATVVPIPARPGAVPVTGAFE